MWVLVIRKVYLREFILISIVWEIVFCVLFVKRSVNSVYFYLDIVNFMNNIMFKKVVIY